MVKRKRRETHFLKKKKPSVFGIRGKSAKKQHKCERSKHVLGRSKKKGALQRAARSGRKASTRGGGTIHIRKGVGRGSEELGRVEGRGVLRKLEPGRLKRKEQQRNVCRRERIDGYAEREKERKRGERRRKTKTEKGGVLRRNFVREPEERQSFLSTK